MSEIYLVKVNLVDQDDFTCVCENTTGDVENCQDVCWKYSRCIKSEPEYTDGYFKFHSLEFVKTGVTTTNPDNPFVDYCVKYYGENITGIEDLLCLQSYHEHKSEAGPGDATHFYWIVISEKYMKQANQDGFEYYLDLVSKDV